MPQNIKHNLKRLVFLVSDATFGRVIRIFQKSLAMPKVNTTSVLDLLKNYGVQSSAEFAINEMQNAMVFTTREDLWKYVINTLPASITQNRIEYSLEFGVFKGDSLNKLAILSPKTEWTGFDSFDGLEEDWPGTALTKGFFGVEGKLPKVVGNVKLVKGWVEVTLSEFLNQHQNRQVSIIHFDMDTYKPTSYVLQSLYGNGCFGPGTTLIFDEYFGYSHSWKLNEHRAFSDWIGKYGIKFQYIAHTNTAVAVRLS
jgi:hypothetical protein